MVYADSEWAGQQWGTVALGDRRLGRLAVRMGACMAAHPAWSLPRQMQSPRLLRAAYGLLNHPGVSLAALTAPHRAETLRRAGEQAVVLLVEDTSELNYTAQRHTQGLGPIGDGQGRGLLLHSTLAVVPDSRQVLGLAHTQVVLRVPNPHSRRRPASAEGRVWQVSAQQVGAPPAGRLWVHVSDRASDDFAYLTTCRHLGKHFLVRVRFNRKLLWPAAEPLPARHLLAHARSLPAAPGSRYQVRVPAHHQQPARTASVVLAWAQVTLVPPIQTPHEPAAGERCQRQPLTVWVLRAWEPEPPADVTEPLAWTLLSSLPIHDLADARRYLAWYTCRWLCEDYHQCLKTGCRIEHSQLDDAADLQRLLGFAAPIAVRLLQLRQDARHAPEVPALQVVEPLMVKILAQRYALDAPTLTLSEFYRHLAILGGYQNRRRDGPPGWRTLWYGWRLLSDLAAGARLVAEGAIT